MIRELLGWVDRAFEIQHLHAEILHSCITIVVLLSGHSRRRELRLALIRFRSEMGATLLIAREPSLSSLVLSSTSTWLA